MTKQFDGWKGTWTWVPKQNHEHAKGIVTVGLFSGDFFNVNAPFLSVDGLNLTLSAFLGASHDLDCITLADWNGTTVILGSQFLIQVATHDFSSDVGWCGEVGLS